MMQDFSQEKETDLICIAKLNTSIWEGNRDSSSKTILWSLGRDYQSSINNPAGPRNVLPVVYREQDRGGGGVKRRTYV